MDEDKRVSATCPICHEGELRRMDGPPEWYVIPAATLGLPDDEEKRGAACQWASAYVRVASTSPCSCRQPSMGPRAATHSRAPAPTAGWCFDREAASFEPEPRLRGAVSAVCG